MVLCCIVAAFSFGPSSEAATPVDAQTELRAAIDVLKAYDINREHVDWPPVEAHAQAMISGKAQASDAYPAIAYVVGQMGDRHSFLRPAQEAEALRTDKPSENGKPIGETMLPQAGRIPDDIIAINIPGHTGSPESDRAYAKTLRTILARAQQFGFCRILIDLRWNNGGNMWPMLQGLAPLLGQEPYGYFLGTDGKETAWTLSDRKSDGIDSASEQEIDALSTAAVAVLIGRGTASSGEFTAMAFRGRPNTMFFGAPTSGFVTANGQYQLPDGAQLFVAQSWATDRLHRPYKVAVVPDQNMIESEAADAGQTWLKQQKCAPAAPQKP